MTVILISRVGLGLHYLSDVLGGVTLGVATYYITIQISAYDLQINHAAFSYLSSIFN